MDKFYTIQSNTRSEGLGQTGYKFYYDKDENTYDSYGSQVKEIHNMYYNQTNWGCAVTRSVIDIRTNLIASEGPSIIAKNEQTQEWIDNFLKQNNLYSSKLINMVRIGEMEGRCLTILKPNKKKKYIRVLPTSFYENNYFVESDYDEIIEVYQLTKEKKKITFNNSIVTKLSGNSYQYNETTPLLSNVIENIKAIDRAMNDFREANRLYGFPTPAIEVKEGEDAKTIAEGMSQQNWKVGTSFVSNGKLYFPSIPEAYNSLIKEIELHYKIISGITAIPVHWFGWVELMSNMATYVEIENMIKISTTKDRTIWSDSIKEIIIKAMELSVDNGFDNAILDTDFDVSIPYLSPQYTQYLSSIYLPLYQSDIITKKEFRSFIPSLDVDSIEDDIDNGVLEENDDEE